MLSSVSSEPPAADSGFFLQVEAEIGDDGIATASLPNTPLMHLIETVWGLENTYYLLNVAYPHGQTFTPDPLPGTAHQRHLERMASLIESGEVDYTIPESSLLALEVCEGAYISSRHRCKVTFPVDAFTPPAPVDWDPGRPYSGQGGGRDGRKL